MDKWKGRVAVVTGANAGIGAAIVKDLVESGMVVVGLARREELFQNIKSQLQGKPGLFHSFKADITKEEDVKAAFQWTKDNLGGVDVLVNNAGISLRLMACDGEIEEWKRLFELNVFALGACTREALTSMKERHVDDGHIININSIGSHRVGSLIRVAPYCSSKFASKAITEGVRLELAAQKSKIKVTSISPGLVKTEMADLSYYISNFSEASKISPLEPKDIADAVHYVLATPPHVQVNELIVRPVGEGI